MKITKATNSDKADALLIAKELKQWFTEEGQKNMRVDFIFNNVVVAKEKTEVVGFLCYSTYCGKILLMWMGVKKESQRQKVGETLIFWLEKEAKKFGINSIEVETLTDKDEYEPYKITRAFYLKNGFKKIYYKKARVKDWDDQIVLEKNLINL